MPSIPSGESRFRHGIEQYAIGSSLRRKVDTMVLYKPQIHHTALACDTMVEKG